MAINILIPYNFTPNDKKAIHFVGRQYKDEKEVDITLFHAFVPVPEIDAQNNPVMKRMMSNISYLQEQQKERKQTLEGVGRTLAGYGFDPACIHCLYHPIQTDIAADIIRLWNFEKFDIVVLNRSPGSIINYFSRSNTKRISQYKNGAIRVRIVD